MANTSKEIHGDIDPQAIINGEIIYMGTGSTIEAGAIIHKSAKLYLGENSTIRSGAIIRDEVIIGSNSKIGCNSEIVRSIILGPNTFIPHFNFVGDTIIGGKVNLGGYTATANTKSGDVVKISFSTRKEDKIDTGTKFFGSLIGDNVSFGACTLLCPGTVVLPNLILPPHVVLIGIIDSNRRKKLLNDFFDRWNT